MRLVMIHESQAVREVNSQPLAEDLRKGFSRILIPARLLVVEKPVEVRPGEISLVPVVSDAIDVGDRDSTFPEAEIDRLEWKLVRVLDAAQPLIFDRGNNLTIFQQHSSAVVRVRWVRAKVLLIDAIQAT